MFFKNKNSSLNLTKEIFKVEIVPDVPALARDIDASISASTEFTLNKAAKFIQVYAIAKDIYLKWGTTDVTTSNFDEVIPAGQIRNLLIPLAITAVNVIEREASATVIIIQK